MGMFDLTGHVALVTGAGQNAGAGIARALAEQGAAVAVNDLRPERAEATCAEIGKAGGRAVPVPFDVTDIDAVRAGVARAGEAFGGTVDILVNNAGIPADMGYGPFRDIAPERWRGPVEINLFGAMNCVHAVLPGMRATGWGRVVQISSGAGRTGLAIGVSLYGAGKSGVEGFVRHISQEEAKAGITANTLALGLMQSAGGPGIDRIAEGIPVGRLGRPEDVGAAVAFLVSPEASWLTGQTIDLNGGSHTR
ncbi:SDR family NAD(P)-dependent oxidoreductase [Streptomyces sp. VNUA24]|uniref:SDR family NAD(P)-dependent oxidoreductase n=1 Tax=Streptomyces sp. VNUA24 TaxID=3031131 RepID=UPI0023B7B713|nr:SDR family NAD(P)-dependent oxidoreductase [Streptomyces sp. VNUA24]WEH12903.1 SDR family NAD(P)-dependent oxidoreductase [Streptomyces sp. VNUA24]